MDKVKNLSLIAVFLCAAFIFSCTEEKPVELPPGKTKEYAYSFCVFIDNQLCESGNFSRSCRGNGVLSNSCPFANVVPTYSYCVFIEEERCEEGIFEFCYGGGAVSNNCPYDEIVVVEESSSSSEEASSSSSEEVFEPSSSSEEPSSSSEGRGLRSSSAKTDKDGYEYIDYPTLEPGAPGVVRADLGGVTRYWDGCKPSCSWIHELKPDKVNNKITSPYGISRVCDRKGNEMPILYRQPPEANTHAVFLGTPNTCNPGGSMREWTQSTEYADWKALNPDFPTGDQSGGYICSADQIPYAVNDTLAYAFAATYAGCGRCFQLQFNSEWNFADPRATHRAIAGKTLIVMVNNFGPTEGSFDIMIPGGGVGMFDAVTEQLNSPPGNLGLNPGGLLAECTFGGMDPNRSYAEIGVGLVGGDGGIERRSVAEVKECLTAKCNRAFKDYPALLKGCMWHVDWFEAVDNPEAHYKEVPCPQYLVDRYTSSFSLPTRPKDLLPTAHCEIQGGALQCEP